MEGAFPQLVICCVLMLAHHPVPARGRIHDFRHHLVPTWKLTPERELRKEGLTVMLNTYQRPDMLRSAVEHYHQCNVVRSIRVIWCEKGQPPDYSSWNLRTPARWAWQGSNAYGEKGSSKRSRHKYASPDERLRFHHAPDSLNSRFLPVPNVATSAVFAVDDDIHVPCDDLRTAFHVWGSSQHTLVGFFPRLHVRAASTGERGGRTGSTKRLSRTGPSASDSSTQGEEEGGVAAAVDEATYAATSSSSLFPFPSSAAGTAGSAAVATTATLPPLVQTPYFSGGGEDGRSSQKLRALRPERKRNFAQRKAEHMGEPLEQDRKGGKERVATRATERRQSFRGREMQIRGKQRRRRRRILSSATSAKKKGSDAGDATVRYEYHSWWYVWWTGRYSMVLTKAAIFHADYLRLYSSEMPQPVRDYVDRHMNCEDLAMQFLISNVSGLPPIYVRGNVGDYGGFGGISTRGGHMVARSDCLNDMMQLFGHHTGAAVNSASSSRWASAFSPSSSFSSVFDVSGGQSSAGAFGLSSEPFDGGYLLPKSRFVAGSAGSWRANQPATWLEYVASDLPVPIAIQIIGIILATTALLRGLYLLLGRSYRAACGTLRDGERVPPPLVAGCVRFALCCGLGANEERVRALWKKKRWT